MIDPTTLSPPDDGAWRLYVRDEVTLQRLAEIDDFGELDCILRYNEPSTWVLSGSRDLTSIKLLDIGTGIELTRSGNTIFAGPARSVSDQIDPDGTVRQVSGIDDTGLLADRLALPVPTGPPYTAAEYDVFSGTAEDVMRHYVDVNAGPSATVPRRINGLTVDLPSGIGTSSEFVGIGEKFSVGYTQTFTVPRPLSIRKGDVLLAFLNFGVAPAQTTAVTAPSGWTKQADVTYGGDNRAYVYSHTIGDNETAVVADTWRTADTVQCQARQAAWRGSGGITVVGGVGQAQPTTSGPATPSITTPTANCRLVAFYAADSIVQSVTPNAGFAERWDFDFAYEMSDAVQAAPGASGVKTATVAQSDNFAAILIALQPGNPGAATEITGQARFDNLLELLQSIAIQGGGLRFEVAQQGTERRFHVSHPRDRADTTIFSQELSTLDGARHDREGPLVNYVYAGGGGEGTQREFVERGDSSSLVEHWRVENFVDKRSDTGPALGQAIDETLEKGSPHVGYTLEPAESERLQFGRDYQLGDTVGIVLDGTAYIATIREVSLHLNADGAVIKPTLNPSASLGRSRGFSIGRLNTRLSQIEKNAEGPTLGMIMLWSRDTGSIPSGWWPCDGTLGTVDMRGRFPIGADPTNAAGRGTYALLSPGGATTTSIANHNHSMQSHVHAGPNHDHGMQSHTHADNHGHPAGTTGPMDHFSDTILATGGARDRAHDHGFTTPTRTGNTDGPSNNQTTFAGTGNTGGPSNNVTSDAGASNPSIIPPYLAVHYIQRIST